MSIGYADKLAFRADLGGQLGAAELQEDPSSYEDKISMLSDWVEQSQRIVIFTGAGISTACGIPDFRGPKGVWTLKHAGKPVPAPRTTFIAAKPSLTHQAIIGLLNSGKLKYVVSQNVDGLHLRSGIPRDMLAELHGNCFAERCNRCRQEYIRDFEIETVGFKPTGRKCTQPRCRGTLKDNILDWEDELPQDELKESETQSSAADLVICLGTSLQITPACNLPLRCLKKGGKLVIVNLQKTPKDKRASLVIHSRVDAVMSAIMERCSIPIPPYKRSIGFKIQTFQLPESDHFDQRKVRIAVTGEYGYACPLIISAHFQIQDSQLGSPEVLEEGKLHIVCLLPRSGGYRCRVTVNVDPALDSDMLQHHVIHGFILPDTNPRKEREISYTHHLVRVQEVIYQAKEELTEVKKDDGNLLEQPDSKRARHE